MKCPADGATPVRQISWLSQIYAPTSSADDYLVGAPSRASSHNSQGPFWDIQEITDSLSDGGLVPLGSNDGCPNLLIQTCYRPCPAAQGHLPRTRSSAIKRSIQSMFRLVVVGDYVFTVLPVSR